MKWKRGNSEIEKQINPSLLARETHANEYKNNDLMSLNQFNFRSVVYFGYFHWGFPKCSAKKEK